MNAGRWLAAGLVLLALPAAAQVSGEGTASAGGLQSGGPDVSHQQPFSSEGLWFSGDLSSFDPTKAYALQWQGLGTPDFRFRGTYFQPGWLLDFSVTQRAYLVGGDARFAWDPWSGTLDARVPQVLSAYRAYPGSLVGAFVPSTLTAAQGLLPDSSPGWAMRDYALTFRTLGSDRGVEVSLLSNERSGIVPRTLVAATGFTPVVTPLTAGLPVGSPLGVLEVPDRFSERSMGLDVRGFVTWGSWRWEGEASAERYEFHRLITDWQSPFPGPNVSEPGRFWGTQAMLKVSGRSPNASVSVERTEQWGHGEAGERRTAVTRIKADAHGAAGKATWFVRGYASHRDDDVSLEPPGLHPVFQGPYYDLLGPRLAPMILRVYPYSDLWVEGGLRSMLWEVSARVRHFQSPHSYAQDQDSVLIFLAWTPVRGLRLELRPGATRASNLNPQADKYAGLGGGWQQATNFRPVNARDWNSLEARVSFQEGPLMTRALYSLQDSGDAPGLQRRERWEVFAGYGATLGPWSLRASGRAGRSDLSGTFTTYASPGEPVDPADPTHRLPLGENWRREGQSAQVDLERSVMDVGTFGLVGLWDHEALTTLRVLDQPRHTQYAQVGLFWRRARGAFGFRAEAGVQSLRQQDPIFVPAQPPPGPYLWTGITERPGTRGYVRLDMTWKF
jgi:hypothetical protein